MPSEKQLLEILEKDTVDTRSWMVDDPKEAKYQMERAEGRLYSLAQPQVDGTLRAWHVTDDPQKVVNLLKEKGDFYAREGDLCGGLYVSTVPHFWQGRSNKKWEFLGTLSREARGTLYQAIYDRLVDQINSKYITPSEFENAEGVIAQAMTTDYWQVLVVIANQPYNIDVPKMAKELALATPFEPHEVPVDFVGRYLEFNTERAVKANEALLLLRHGSMEGVTRLDLCNMLKSYGWDGVFTKASMGTNPELVIWSGDKIVAFGDYAPGGAELSGKPPEDFWVSNPLKKARFEALVKADQKSATIFDRKTPFSFEDVTLQEAVTLKSIVDRMNAGERHIRAGRFEAVPIYNNLRIMDLKSKTKQSFMGMSKEDMTDLGELMPALVAALLQ